MTPRKHGYVLIAFAVAISWPLGLLVGASTASALSGNDLYYDCQQRDGPERSRCDTYLSGFFEGVISGYVLGSTGKFCPPMAAIELGQVRLIVEKYLREHPADLHLRASTLGMRAFQEAFKC
jgi:hypothetical protein